MLGRFIGSNLLIFLLSGAAQCTERFSIEMCDNSLQASANQGEVDRDISNHVKLFVAFKHASNATHPISNITILTEDRYSAGIMISLSPAISSKWGYMNMRINGDTYSAVGTELLFHF